MTLLVRDERDIVEEHLAFHLAAGVDEVIVTDHASTDGTEEVLARYERDGRVRVLREPDGPFRQREWVTHMARLAATEHGADWVVNGDADEFWWPRGGSLQEVLAAVPRRYGIVQSLVRHFVPVADDGRPFQERMTYRLRPTAPVNDPASPWRPYRKVVHRASPGRRPRRGRARRALRGSPATARLVPDRVPPLPAAVAGPGRAQGPGVGRCGREVLCDVRGGSERRVRRTTRSSTTPRSVARPRRTTARSRSGPTTSRVASRPGSSRRTCASGTLAGARPSAAAVTASSSLGRRRSRPRRSRSTPPCSARRT